MLGNPDRPRTNWIFQASEVGSPIRRSMDQSLFAAPHGLSQRITSFIACACQGIHQLPLFHLIVLIANAHLEVLCTSTLVLSWRAGRAADGPPNDWRRPFGLAKPCGSVHSSTTTSMTGKTKLTGTFNYVWIKIHTRPASRDMRDDARSGNINHDASQTLPKKRTANDT